MASQISCLHCGSAIDGQAKFCNHCGGRLSGSCSECGVESPAGAKFCVGCGAAVSTAPSVRDRASWRRQPGEFARRLESSQFNKHALQVKGGELQQWLRKGINAFLSFCFGSGVSVEEGTRAYLIQFGAMTGSLDPGFHRIDSLATRLNHVNFNSPYTLLMTDIGDIELPLEMSGLRTADHQTTDARLSLVVTLNDPLEFFTNVMRGQEQVTYAELAGRISQELASVMQSIISGQGVNQLYGNQKLTMQIESELRQALERSLGRYGLRLVHVRFVTFSGDEFGQIREQRAEIVRDEAAHENEQKRLKLAKLVQERLTEERMNELQSAQDLLDFIDQLAHEADVRGLLRAQERAELQRQYEEKKGDHASCREHLLAVLDWQRKREILNLRGEFARTELQASQHLDDSRRQAALRDLDERQAAELKRLNRAHAAELERLDATRASNRGAARAQADDEFERDKRDAELAMQLQRQQKEIRGREADDAHRRELQKLDKFNSLSIEALIAASGADQAAILASLKNTETLKGMTEEQILAMAAEKSPEVGRAFAEKFKATAGAREKEQMQAMYERMLSEKDASSDKMAQMQAENARMLRTIMETAINAQRDTAVSAANPPAVIFPPPGYSVAKASGAPKADGEAGTCGQCRTRLPEGSTFCPECGAKV